MAAVSRLLLKRKDSWVANQRLMVLMDNGRTPGLQISWPGFRGSCTMYFMESRQKEDEEVSSQATTLQFGSPGKSRWEEYVCPGYPHCENFDCDLCDNPSETEVEDYMDWHAKEDAMLNTAPFGTGQYLRNEVRKYHLRRKRKEANDAKLGKGKGRSGGRAAPKKIRKAKEKEKGKEAEPCTCENCMSQETYDLYIKEGFEKAKEKEKAKDKKRKREIEDAELVLETKHAIKQYTLQDLGMGQKRVGGAAAKKNRLEVLDRLARLGQGLSPAQKNDFKWFKEAWDARMLQENGDNWPELFMGWMQRLLGENEDGVGNAFSVFVHNETRRCFDGVSALRVP